MHFSKWVLHPREMENYSASFLTVFARVPLKAEPQKCFFFRSGLVFPFSISRLHCESPEINRSIHYFFTGQLLFSFPNQQQRKIKNNQGRKTISVEKCTGTWTQIIAHCVWLTVRGKPEKGLCGSTLNCGRCADRLPNCCTRKKEFNCVHFSLNFFKYWIVRKKSKHKFCMLNVNYNIIFHKL